VWSQVSVLVQIHFVRSFSFSQVLGWLLGVISLRVDGSD